MSSWTREEAFRLAQYYLQEAITFHEQTNPSSYGNTEHNARRAANAIELAKTFFLIKDDLPTAHQRTQQRIEEARARNPDIYR